MVYIFLIREFNGKCVLYSSACNMTWLVPVPSPFLWLFRCLCCTVWLQCTSLSLRNSDTRINQPNFFTVTPMTTCDTIACSDVSFFYYYYICFFCFASQEYISFRFCSFVCLFSVLKWGLVSTFHSASPCVLTPCIFWVLRLSQW